MTERRDADFFEVLIGQIRQDDKGNVVLGKALRVLPETEFLKPVCNLLHRGPLRIKTTGPAGQKDYHTCQLIVAPGNAGFAADLITPASCFCSRISALP